MIPLHSGQKAARDSAFPRNAGTPCWRLPSPSTSSSRGKVVSLRKLLQHSSVTNEDEAEFEGVSSLRRLFCLIPFLFVHNIHERFAVNEAANVLCNGVPHPIAIFV